MWRGVPFPWRCGESNPSPTSGRVNVLLTGRNHPSPHPLYAGGVALSMKTRKLILARDNETCWHCGETEAISIHHRINKGFGGSKLLDTPDNLMVVCSRYNGDMESDFRVAAQARGWGHKLPNWCELSHPVFDRPGFSWWVLLPDGSKVESDWRDQPF